MKEVNAKAITAEELFEQYAKVINPAKTTVDEATGLRDAKSIMFPVGDERYIKYREMIRPFLANGAGGWLGALTRVLDEFGHLSNEATAHAEEVKQARQERDDAKARSAKLEAENEALLKILDHLHKR